MHSYHVMRKGNFELMAIDFSNVSFYPSLISEPLLLKPRVREGVDTLSGYIYVDSSQYLSWFLLFEAMLRDAFLVHGCHLCLKAAVEVLIQILIIHFCCSGMASCCFA